MSMDSDIHHRKPQPQPPKSDEYIEAMEFPKPAPKPAPDMPTTVVSPEVTGTHSPVVVDTPTPTGEKVILIPMSEWKQCAQRGVRSGIQAATYTLGGGSIALLLSQFGVTPDLIDQIPTTGNKLFDALLFSVVFGLLCFVWNMVEFWLDIDIKAPKWRA